MSPRRRATDNAAVERLVDQRREVVGRAVRVLDTDLEVPIEVQPETLRETVALLSVSREELKVAEEELVQQNEELALTRAAAESSTRHFGRRFDEAPLAYVVTDTVGMKLVDAAHDWRVTLLRHGDGPVSVTLDVRLSRGERPGEDQICWMLRPAVAAPVVH